jgi:hypothetical protein
MFERIMDALKGKGLDSQEDGSSRRQHERREQDAVVTIIGGKTFPVENWSKGGVLIYGDSKPFTVNEQIPVTMKFKLRNDIIALAHQARIVRKTHEKVALQFAPMTDTLKRGFQSVIDDSVAGEFAESQQA